MIKSQDPDDWCVNCGREVMSYYRNCPWCGKIWWKKDDRKDRVCEKTDNTSDREKGHNG